MPESPRRFVAVLILEAVVRGPSPEEPLFEQQIHVFDAADPEAAYQRAVFLGKSEELSYRNPDGEKVEWTFRGLHDLQELAPSPDATEVYSFFLRGARAFEVIPKEDLLVFSAPTHDTDDA